MVRSFLSSLTLTRYGTSSTCACTTSCCLASSMFGRSPYSIAQFPNKKKANLFCISWDLRLTQYWYAFSHRNMNENESAPNKNDFDVSSPEYIIYDDAVNVTLLIMLVTVLLQSCLRMFRQVTWWTVSSIDEWTSVDDHHFIFIWMNRCCICLSSSDSARINRKSWQIMLH